MLGKGESKHRVGCQNPRKQHFRTSWVQPSWANLHNIPQIYWSCPPRFLVDPDWKMEAGSESQETHIQLQRESRTAEVIYYCESDIPPNPLVASNALDFNDVSRIPVIPLDVTSDETSPDDPLISPGPTAKVGEKTTQPLLPRDEVIGTAVALVALIKSKEPGSQIDLELLIQLLCNPRMLDQLMKENRFLANQNSVIPRAQPHDLFSVPMPNTRSTVRGYSTWSPSAPFSPLTQGVKNMIEQIQSHTESQKRSSNKKVDVGKLRKLINEYGVHLRDDSVKTRPAVVKDANYYRRLVLLHGMSQENDKPQGYVKSIRSQELGPCAYFNSPKGCRHGSSCLFQHVKGGSGGGSQGVQEQQGAKRMKLSGGIFARHT